MVRTQTQRLLRYVFRRFLIPSLPKLIISTLTGDGFQSDGARLGGSHGIPQHIGRIKGLEAAERRAAKSTLMGKGGRLGGAVPKGSISKSPRQMAVEVRTILCSSSRARSMLRVGSVSVVGRGKTTEGR